MEHPAFVDPFLHGISMSEFSLKVYVHNYPHGKDPICLRRLHFSHWPLHSRILVYRYALRSIPDRELVFGLTAVSLPLYLTPLLLTTGAYHSIPVSPQTLAVSGELVREVVLHMCLAEVFIGFHRF